MDRSPKARLQQLQELVDAGLMTPEEYEASRKAIIEETTGVGSRRKASDFLAGNTTVASPASDDEAGEGGATDNPLAGGTQVGGVTPAAPLEGSTRVASHSHPGTPPHAQAALEVPPTLGNYKVLGVIGAGGMGTVVRARHVEEGWAAEQGGDVAIKLIHPQISADEIFRSRFFAEAALGRRVQHPGLATVYDVISEGPWLGTILEYIEGEELSASVRPGGIDLDEALRLLTPLADALDHLHAQGIIHRDLKPANVKVRPDGTPVLLDLGIAKDLERDQGSVHRTQTMTAMGTTAWMAPEQADARNVTGAADRYALGLITYALLSGGMPWPDDTTSLRALMTKMTGDLTPLSEARPGLPADVYEAMERVLSVDPDARPDTANAFVSQLRSTSAQAALDAAAAAAAGKEASSVAVPPEQPSGDTASAVRDLPPPPAHRNRRSSTTANPTSPKPKTQTQTQSRPSKTGNSGNPGRPPQPDRTRAPAQNDIAALPTDEEVTDPGVEFDPSSQTGTGVLALGLVAAIGAAGVVGGFIFFQSSDSEPSTVATQLAPDMSLARSTAETMPLSVPHIVVGGASLQLDGEEIISLKETSAGGPLRIPEDALRGQQVTKLYDKLDETRSSREMLLRDPEKALSILTQRDDLGLQDEVVLSIEPDTPFSVVRAVMYTAGQAGFSRFQFTTRNPWLDDLRTIESTLPSIGPPSLDGGDDGPPPLNLSVIVDSRGITVFGADAVLHPDGAPSVAEGEERTPTIPCKGRCDAVDDYDWAALNAKLAEVKDAYPQDLDIIVVPSQKTPVDILYRTLDSARWTGHIPLDASHDQWNRWKTDRGEMFPAAVIAGGAL